MALSLFILDRKMWYSPSKIARMEEREDDGKQLDDSGLATSNDDSGFLSAGNMQLSGEIRDAETMEIALKAAEPRLSDPGSKASDQPKYAENEFRSAKPEVMVMEGVCTHLGCSPQLKAADAKGEMGGDWVGGFYCPCHGSKFDLAGRVFRGAPAPLNLKVPPYTFVSDSKLVIGEDDKTKGA